MSVIRIFRSSTKYQDMLRIEFKKSKSTSFKILATYFSPIFLKKSIYFLIFDKIIKNQKKITNEKSVFIICPQRRRIQR